MNRAAPVYASLAFGAHSCARTVHGTVGDWPTGSTLWLTSIPSTEGFFLVGYVEERPRWPIQSPNKGTDSFETRNNNQCWRQSKGKWAVVIDWRQLKAFTGHACLIHCIAIRVETAIPIRYFAYICVTYYHYDYKARKIATLGTNKWDLCTMLFAVCLSIQPKMGIWCNVGGKEWCWKQLTTLPHNAFTQDGISPPRCSSSLLLSLGLKFELRHNATSLLSHNVLCSVIFGSICCGFTDRTLRIAGIKFENTRERVTLVQQRANVRSLSLSFDK